MKNTLTLLAFVFSIFCGRAFAQDSYEEVARSVLSTEKKAAMAEILVLTPEEEKAFWPLYNEYQSKMYELGTVKLQLIRDFGKNFESMTDETATEFMKRFENGELEYEKLRKSYTPKFSKVLGPKKALTYLQAENKIRAMINYELAQAVPLFED